MSVNYCFRSDLGPRGPWSGPGNYVVVVGEKLKREVRRRTLIVVIINLKYTPKTK